MQYKGRPNRIKWKMELRRWRHSIFHFSFSIFHSRWKMESIWRRIYFRFSDINRKWKMDYWRHSFNIFARMKNEKWKMEVDIPFFIWWHQMKNQNNGMYTDPWHSCLWRARFPSPTQNDWLTTPRAQSRRYQPVVRPLSPRHFCWRSRPVGDAFDITFPRSNCFLEQRAADNNKWMLQHCQQIDDYSCFSWWV